MLSPMPPNHSVTSASKSYRTVCLTRLVRMRSSASRPPTAGRRPDTGAGQPVLAAASGRVSSHRRWRRARLAGQDGRNRDGGRPGATRSSSRARPGPAPIWPPDSGPARSPAPGPAEALRIAVGPRARSESIRVDPSRANRVRVPSGRGAVRRACQRGVAPCGRSPGPGGAATRRSSRRTWECVHAYA